MADRFYKCLDLVRNSGDRNKLQLTKYIWLDQISGEK